MHKERQERIPTCPSIKVATCHISMPFNFLIYTFTTDIASNMWLERATNDNLDWFTMVVKKEDAT